MSARADEDPRPCLPVAQFPEPAVVAIGLASPDHRTIVSHKIRAGDAGDMCERQAESRMESICCTL